MSSKRIIIALIVGAITAFTFLEIRRDASSSDEVSPEQKQAAQTPIETSQLKTQPLTKQVTQPESQKDTSIVPKITECKIETSVSSKEYIERFNRESTQLDSNIAQLNTFESRLFKVLTDVSDGKIALDNAFSLTESYPNNDLANYHALSLCSNDPNLCSKSTVSEITGKLANNGAAWLLKAIYHASEDDTAAVETAIIEASKATTFNGHWQDFVSAIANVYQNAGDTGTQLQDEIKMGYIAAIALPSYGSLHQVCEQASVDKLTLIEACLTAGQLLERDSKTLLAKFISFSMQEIALEKLDRPEELSDLATTRQTYKDILTLKTKAIDLIWRNTPLRHQMLRQLIEHGEIAYAQFAIEEAIKLSNAPDVDECQVVP
ncbi:MAG: hypothetical protein ACPGR2_07690 [Psychrobium sp.]